MTQIICLVDSSGAWSIIRQFPLITGEFSAAQRSRVCNLNGQKGHMDVLKRTSHYSFNTLPNHPYHKQPILKHHHQNVHFEILLHVVSPLHKTLEADYSSSPHHLCALSLSPSSSPHRHQTKPIFPGHLERAVCASATHQLPPFSRSPRL